MIRVYGGYFRFQFHFFFLLNLLTLFFWTFLPLFARFFGVYCFASILVPFFCSQLPVITSWFNCTYYICYCCCCMCVSVAFFVQPHRHLLCSDLCRSNTDSFFFFAPTSCAQSFETHHHDWMCTLHPWKMETCERQPHSLLRIDHGKFIKTKLNAVRWAKSAELKKMCAAEYRSLNIETNYFYAKSLV